MTEYKFKFNNSVISCEHTVTDVPKNESFRMHAHDQYEIYYFLSGNAKYLVEGTEYDLKRHDLLVMKPSETHRLIVIDESVPYERAVLNFSPSVLSGVDGAGELLSQFANKPLGKFNRYRSENFRNGFYKTCIENMYANQTKVGTELNIISNLIPLLLELKFAYYGDDGEYATDEMIEYVNAHLFDDISLSGISEELYMSMTKINRNFKRLTGTTLWNYVKIKRLIAAREEIRLGKNANDVARKCGYNDYSAFYRAYVGHFGSSPGKSKPAS